MLQYSFQSLGLQNILLQVYEYNEAGIKAYKSSGFKIIGRRRGSYYQKRRILGYDLYGLHPR